jgi:alkyl sulfatase BDS1-like metallo-beta-lactamase superfamily hydrolase
MATNLDVENLKNENQCINLVLSDTKENFSLWVENSIMQFKRHDDSKDLASDCPTLTLTKPLYLKMITGQIKGVKVLLSKESKVKGNPLEIGKFFAMFKRPDSTFPIVTRPND